MIAERIKEVRSFAGLPDDSHLWDVMWKSYSQTDDTFREPMRSKCERIAHLRNRWIHGGSFRLPDGGYAIILRNPRDLSILRHEIQHVIDDADSILYARDPMYYEHRSVWAEHQNECATRREIEALYS